MEKVEIKPGKYEEISGDAIQNLISVPAGTIGKMVDVEDGFVLVVLPSGLLITVPEDSIKAAI